MRRKCSQPASAWGSPFRSSSTPSPSTTLPTTTSPEAAGPQHDIVGVTCAGHGIACEAALQAFLHALTANWISAGVRLIPLGQTDGQRVLAALEPVVAATATRALNTPVDEIGSSALRADIASMRHETQYTRLFRS